MTILPPIPNPQTLMIADESLIIRANATIHYAMKEQRTQAYLDLINRLLSCNNGDEPRILQQNQELPDEGLVQVMVAVAQCLGNAIITTVLLKFLLRTGLA
ncbi:MAG: hypothetical protein ACKPBT_20685 [Microcystis aeruginosa]